MGLVQDLRVAQFESTSHPFFLIQLLQFLKFLNDLRHVCCSLLIRLRILLISRSQKAMRSEGGKVTFHQNVIWR